jgi:hypothetical protein
MRSTVSPWFASRPAHAELTERRHDLGPDPLHAHRVAERVEPERRRQLLLREGRERHAERGREALGGRAQDQVVEDVDLHLELDVLRDVHRGLEAEPHVGAAERVRVAAGTGDAAEGHVGREAGRERAGPVTAGLAVGDAEVEALEHLVAEAEISVDLEERELRLGRLLPLPLFGGPLIRGRRGGLGALRLELGLQLVEQLLAELLLELGLQLGRRGRGRRRRRDPGRGEPARGEGADEEEERRRREGRRDAPHAGARVPRPRTGRERFPQP